MHLSKFISIILHPIFMPFIAFYFSINAIPKIGIASNSLVNIIYSIIIATTILIPLSNILILIKKGKVSSLEMSNHQERSLPLLYTAIWMSLGYYLLEGLLIYLPVLKAQLLAAILIIASAAIISRFWKISLHMLGIGGLVGILIALQLSLGGLTAEIMLVILLSGILGSARLFQKAHNHSQLYIGFLLGLSIALFTFLLY